MRRFTIRLDLDQRILKGGLREVIEADQSFSCVDGELERRADITVIDLSDTYGDEMLNRQDSDADTMFVALAEVVDSDTLERIVESDVRAVVAKTTDSSSFLEVLRIVISGGRWLDPKLLGVSTTDELTLEEQPESWESLTDRELEVAKLMLQGGQTDTISIALGISHHTVRNHRRNIFRKLNIHSRLELVRYCDLPSESCRRFVG